MSEIQTIDRGIKKELHYQGNTYGTDLKGNYFVMNIGTRKIKGTIDDYELIKKWDKVHYMSYEKMEVIKRFKEL